MNLFPALLELLDDTRMLAFGQRDLSAIDEGSQDQQHDWCRKHDELELEQIRRRDIRSRGIARHADPDGRHADDAAGDSAGKFIDERTHAEADCLITMAELELAILNRVRNRHEDDQEDQRLRQGKQASADEGHGDIRTCHEIDSQSCHHDGNRGQEQLTAAEHRRQHREQRHSQQADDDIDDTENREFRCIADNIDKVVQVEVVDDILAKAKDKISNCHPQQLVVLSQDFEYILSRRIRLVLTQRRLLLLRTQAQDDGTESCDAAADAGKGQPTRRIAGAAILVQREIKDNRHDDDRDELTAEYRTDTGNRRRDLTLMRVKGQGRDHRPDSDILGRVEYIHDEIDDSENDKIERRIRDSQTAHVRKQQCQRDSGDKCTDENPWLESSPARLGLIDDVADERIDKELRDAQHEDYRRDNTDHIGIARRILRTEQVARDENHEVRAQHGIEHIMAKGSAGISNAWPHTAFFL